MAQLPVLVAGLLFFVESQASDVADRSTLQGFLSKSDYDKFITPNVNRIKHGNELGASPFTVVDDKPILQSSTQVQNSHDPISLSIFGIGLVSFVTMLGLSLRRALQPATIPTNTMSASGGQVMEMKAQDSNVKVNSGRVGWGQLSSNNSRPQTICYATKDGWQPLEKAFAIRGPVAKGYGRGSSKLGFATANLDADVIGDVLGDVEQGVYAAFYQTAASTEPKQAVVNVGVAPTFEGQEHPVKLIEAHLLDHDGSALYGEGLALLLVAFIRPEMKFDGIEALKTQIGVDCETAKSALADEAAWTINYVQGIFLSQAAWKLPPSATQWFAPRQDSGEIGDGVNFCSWAEQEKRRDDVKLAFDN